VENRIPGSRRDVGAPGSSSNASYPSTKAAVGSGSDNMSATSVGMGASRGQSIPPNPSSSTAPIVEDMVTKALEVLVDHSNYPGNQLMKPREDTV
jgi:hypothetical protein